MEARVVAGSNVRDALCRISMCVFGFLACTATIFSAVPMAVAPQTPLSLAAMISKLCIVVFYSMMIWFTLIRDRPRAQAAGWLPRAAALLGSFLLLGSLMWLRKPNEIGIAAHAVSAVFLILGSSLTIFTLRWLGRSFSIMAEARTLVTTGPYSVIRHPLYVAELVATIGVVIEYISWVTVAIAITQFAFQVQRMRNEETVLSGIFPEYRAYSLRTARLIPGVW
jgi:protein-S-isoprenylcysteine O-methyltransferase Ste14